MKRQRERRRKSGRNLERNTGSAHINLHMYNLYVYNLYVYENLVHTFEAQHLSAHIKLYVYNL